jgi:integrase
VGQYLTRWLEESVKPAVRPLTYEQYAQHVRLYLEPALGKISLSKLSPQQVQSFINNMSKQGLSARTVQLALFVLRRALKRAVKWNLVARNVAGLVDGPGVERKEVKPPTFEQVRRLLDTVKGDPFEAAFTAGLALGMRRGEILGLRWEEIDFEGRTISVKQALQRSGGKHVDGEGRRSKLHILWLPRAFGA